MKRLALIFALVFALCTFFAMASAAVSLGGLAGKAKESVSKNDDKKSDSNGIGLKLPPYTGPKKRLGVMDMEIKITTTTSIEPTSTGGVVSTTSTYIPPPSDFGTGLTEMLTTCLVNSNRFIVLERKALGDIQAEQALQASGSVDPASAVAQSKLLGAQYLIRGAVTEYTYKRSTVGGDAIIKGLGLATSKAEAAVVLDIRIYDVKTGIIIDSQKAEGRAKASATAVSVDKEDYKMSASGFSQTPLGQATREAIEKAVLFIIDRMEKLPWEGRIAEIIDEDDGSRSIYINAGEDMGMKKGLELKILRPGKEIIDPETRVAIGRSKDKVLGKCRIETVSKSLSIAVPVEGQGFQVGDIVRLLEDSRPTVNTSKPAEACETNEAKPNSNSK